MAAGRADAEEILRERAVALRRREAAIAAAGPESRLRSPAPATARMRAAGPRGVATLVAEGDSWFDYLWYDVLDFLEQQYGYDIESVAHKGDRVEDMAYSGDELRKFSKTVEKLLRRGEVPKAILLSGGGNDVAGEEFALLLDHARSVAPGLNEDVVRGVIDVRVRNAFAHILSAVTQLCEGLIGRKVPILVHGYDRPVPDGRGFLGGAWVLPGPWLRPGFHQKGFPDQAQNQQIVAALIDRFNAMLAAVAALPGFGHVHYVDLRGLLPNQQGYRQWWENELHPTRKGFELVAQKFQEVLKVL
jgi:lysophospholipase L1-like esterase